MDTSKETLRVAVVGASGYTGAELVRLLAHHPNVQLTALTADRKAGQTLPEVFPHLAVAAETLRLPPLVSTEEVDWSAIDAAFFGLPHGAAQTLAAKLPWEVRIIDLSPDFRFADVDVYRQWYGAHKAPGRQEDAVYGLTELAREEIRTATLVACPGCYPTSSLLPLMPIVSAGLVDLESIIIDAKSGVSGAGRAAKEGSLYAEVAEGIHAYGVAQHRHSPEIEQGVSRAAGKPVPVTFTPHLMPMNRGILSTIYIRPTRFADAAAIQECLAERYAGEAFVHVLPLGQAPATRHVRGSNHCLIGVVADRVPGRVIVISVIDNLVKGASGQAVQNMNVMLGLEETLGLKQEPMFP